MKSGKCWEMSQCIENGQRGMWSNKLLHDCRASDEKAVAVNDSVASCTDSVLASGDITADSIQEHKYEFY